MNYIKEINSFYDWLELNSVSDSVITLWHAMMHINNKSGWKVEFTVAISTLQVKTSLSKSSIIRARNILKQLGRLEFKERKGNQSCIYKLIAFHTETQNETQSETHFVTQTDTQTVTQTDTQTVTQTDTINKLNYTKQNSILLKKESKEEKIEKENFETEFFPETEPVKKEEEKRKKVAQKKEKAQPPDLDAFVDYAREIYQNELKLDFSLYEFAVRAKYSSWKDAGWKDGHKKPINSWKNKVRNIIPFLKPIYGKSSNQNTINGAGTGGNYGGKVDGTAEILTGVRYFEPS